MKSFTILMPSHMCTLIRASNTHLMRHVRIIIIVIISKRLKTQILHWSVWLTKLASYPNSSHKLWFYILRKSTSGQKASIRGMSLPCPLSTTPRIFWKEQIVKKLFKNINIVQDTLTEWKNQTHYHAIKSIEAKKMRWSSIQLLTWCSTFKGHVSLQHSLLDTEIGAKRWTSIKPVAWFVAL